MHIKGLDGLRFFCALVVIISHLGIDFTNYSCNNSILYFITGILNNSFSGIGAVLVFFVISGFCIHIPYANGKEIHIKEFYMKRFIRISIPAAVAAAIFYFVAHEYLNVLWSLICELLYYFVYPLLLILKRKYSNISIIIVLYVISFVIIIPFDIWDQTKYGIFPRYGEALDWIACFPSWFIGVMLADYVVSNKETLTSITFLNIWMIRIASWSFTIAASILRFQLNISYSLTLPFFCIVVYYWLLNEIKFYTNNKENTFIVKGGMMSYSLYIFHFTIIYLVSDYLSNDHKYSLQTGSLTLIMILIASYIFYLLVEKPSHELARKVKFKGIV
ncbi:MAG: acyltransferase family protein [Cytophaga sp.]|uniref:acyltransferase family protein n=1 Tax=Cytophaga sp. TaxID=29535 RepID=UPI003F8205AB